MCSSAGGAAAPVTREIDVVAAGVRFRVRRTDPPRAAGPPVLLLHGVPETGLMWRDLAAELGTDRVVLAPDLKGLGGSEARGRYDVPTLVAELVALARDQLTPPFDVAGHDWGGSLAAVLATRHPDLTRRLVVVNAPFRRVDYARAWHMLAFSLPGLPEAVFRLGGRGFVRFLLRACWRAPRPLDPEIAEAYAAAYDDPDRVAAMLAYYRAATRPRIARTAGRAARGAAGPAFRWLAGRPGAGGRDSGGRGSGRWDGTAVPERRGQPPAGAAPALVVWGARDPVLPVSVGEAAVADLGPGTEMITVPEAGHFAVEEAPEIVVPAIAAFLRR